MFCVKLDHYAVDGYALRNLFYIFTVNYITEFEFSEN